MGARSDLEELLFVWDASLWKNLLGGGGPVMVLQYLFPSQIDAIGGVPDVDKNSWGSFCWWMDKPTRTVLKGPKKPETQKSKLRRLFCHRWVGNTKLSLGGFFFPNMSVGPQHAFGRFFYPRLGWQVQACFGSFVLAKGRLGGGGGNWDWQVLRAQRRIQGPVNELRRLFLPPTWNGDSRLSSGGFSRSEAPSWTGKWGRASAYSPLLTIAATQSHLLQQCNSRNQFPVGSPNF